MKSTVRAATTTARLRCCCREQGRSYCHNRSMTFWYVCVHPTVVLEDYWTALPRAQRLVELSHEAFGPRSIEHAFVIKFASAPQLRELYEDYPKKLKEVCANMFAIKTSCYDLTAKYPRLLPNFEYSLMHISGDGYSYYCRKSMMKSAAAKTKMCKAAEEK